MFNGRDESLFEASVWLRLTAPLFKMCQPSYERVCRVVTCSQQLQLTHETKKETRVRTKGIKIKIQSFSCFQFDHTGFLIFTEITRVTVANMILFSLRKIYHIMIIKKDKT